MSDLAATTAAAASTTLASSDPGQGRVGFGKGGQPGPGIIPKVLEDLLDLLLVFRFFAAGIARLTKGVLSGRLLEPETLQTTLNSMAYTGSIKLFWGVKLTTTGRFFRTRPKIIKLPRMYHTKLQT